MTMNPWIRLLLCLATCTCPIAGAFAQGMGLDGSEIRPSGFSGGLIMPPEELKPEPTPEETKPAEPPKPLVFLTEEEIESRLTTSGLEENTLYWTNRNGDPAQGPTLSTESSDRVVTIKGTGKKETRKADTIMELVTIYKVPPGATGARITMEAKWDYSASEDNNPKNVGMPVMSYTLRKAGRVGAKTCPIPNPTTKGRWKQTTKNYEIPPGADTLVFAAKTDLPNALSLTRIKVEFELPAP